jgi:hypothetical protein
LEPIFPADFKMRATQSFSTNRASPLSQIKGAGDKSGEVKSEIQQQQDLFRIMSTSMVPQVCWQVLQMEHQLKQAIESKSSEISPGWDPLRDKTTSAAASHQASEQRYNEFSNVSKSLLWSVTTDHSKVYSQLENSTRKEGAAEESRFRSQYNDPARRM